MAKLTRLNLARGIKLAKDYVYDVFDSVRDFLNDHASTKENYEQQRGRFWIMLNVPNADWQVFLPSTNNVSGSDSGIGIPFTLTPWQRYFSFNGVSNPDTPSLRLDQLSVSFDQRAEPAGITAHYSAVPQPTVGDLNYVAAKDMSLRVGIYEKTMVVHGGGYIPEREIVSFTIPSSVLIDPFYRQNPFLITDIAKELNPYKSYLVLVQSSIASQTYQWLTFPSLTIGLGISSDIVARTVAEVSSDVQNMPTNNTGSKNSSSVVINSPLANGLITSDNAVGVQTNALTIDEYLRDKLEGGYTQDSAAPVVETIGDDACYEVIAVPMWQNPTQKNVASAEVGYTLPYAGADPYVGPCCDQRIISLDYPVIVHHAFAVLNYINPRVSGNQEPQSATYYAEVGVAIGSGWRGDHITWQQVAHQTWNVANKSGKVIDSIKLSRDNVATAGNYDVEIMPIPLVNAGVDGEGYALQGKPFFMGRATSYMQNRTNVGQVAAAPSAPRTKGLETHIGVRWSFGDTAGLSHSTRPLLDLGNTYAGIGGNWVFLVCEKVAVNPALDLKL
jgi:hypothetical protein